MDILISANFSSTATVNLSPSSLSLGLGLGRGRLSNTVTVNVASKFHFLSSSSYPCNSLINSVHGHSISTCKASPLSLWTVSEIAEAVNGEIVKWGCPGTISTDTRTLQPSQWFFAITGEKFDAHDFISPQLSRDKGCSGVIANRVCPDWDKGFVQLHHPHPPLSSLISMAFYARNNRFPPGSALVGVTGSVGKTTTRNMIALALQNPANHWRWVHQSCGNRNNRIGVALTLLGVPSPGNGAGPGVAVVEMGMSREGEILELARMARPSIALILNVGHSHFESFASLQEIAMAKGEILIEAKPGDECVLNADDPLVMSLPVPQGVKRVLFGRSMGSDVRLVAAESVDGGLGVRVVLEKSKEMVEFKIPSPGLHLAMNACAAAAVATLLGISLSQVGKSLSNFSPVPMRSELEVARNGIKIINDAYNANPVSTKAAINLLRSIECNGKRVAILGDMLELGETEMKHHEMILSLCCNGDIDLIGLVGKRFIRAADNIGELVNIVHGHDSDILALKITTRLRCDDVVLVKGSRAMQMERIVKAIKSLHIEE